jgi:hypothetical protein
VAGPSELQAQGALTNLDDMAGVQHVYLRLVLPRLAAPARDWLLARAPRLSAADVAVTFSGCGRRLGSAPLEPSPAERAELAVASLPVPEGWPLSAVGRAALLLTSTEQLEPSERVALVERLFRSGDNDERAAILKTLSLLPEPQSFVELAVDACRSHVQSVFEAIACENPYPARWFPEPNFNQLVLKAFFVGVAVQRIEGLSARRGPELVRMALAYASERRAAGRSVPPDLELVTGPAPTASENSK